MLKDLLGNCYNLSRLVARIKCAVQHQSCQHDIYEKAYKTSDIAFSVCITICAMASQSASTQFTLPAYKEWRLTAAQRVEYYGFTNHFGKQVPQKLSQELEDLRLWSTSIVQLDRWVGDTCTQEQTRMTRTMTHPFLSTVQASNVSPVPG